MQIPNQLVDVELKVIDIISDNKYISEISELKDLHRTLISISLIE